LRLIIEALRENRMRLFRSIAGAQGGRVFANMGAAFGVNDELAAQVVRYFLPPIKKSIAKRMQTSQGLIYFLEMIGAQRHDRYLADPGIFGHPKVEEEGRAILGTLFPNSAHLRKIISNRTKVLPVQPEIIESMLPYVAILAIGAIELKTRQPLKGILLTILNGRADPVAAANPYKSLAIEIRRRRALEGGREPDRRSALGGIIGALFSKPDTQEAA
jgi:hypothetical protein